MRAQDRGQPHEGRRGDAPAELPGRAERVQRLDVVLEVERGLVDVAEAHRGAGAVAQRVDGAGWDGQRLAGAERAPVAVDERRQLAVEYAPALVLARMEVLGRPERARRHRDLKLDPS